MTVPLEPAAVAARLCYCYNATCAQFIHSSAWRDDLLRRFAFSAKVHSDHFSCVGYGQLGP